MKTRQENSDNNPNPEITLTLREPSPQDNPQTLRDPALTRIQQLTVQTADVPEELDRPTIYSGLRVQSSFHLHSNHISNELLAAGSIPAEEALRFNTSLDAWCRTIPSYFQIEDTSGFLESPYRFAKSRLWWRIWNLKMILFRHIVLNLAIKRKQHPDTSVFETTGPDEKCRDLAVRAAHSTIVSVSEFIKQETMTRLINWYAT